MLLNEKEKEKMERKKKESALLVGVYTYMIS